MEGAENDVEEVKSFNPTTDDPQDTEPDPDESIMLDSHDNQMWLVKASVHCRRATRPSAPSIRHVSYSYRIPDS